MRAQKRKRTTHDWLTIFIAVGGGIVLTLLFCPEAKLLQNDISNNVSERQISENTLELITPSQKDILYCDTKNYQQSFDLYLPKNTKNAPLLIFIHGGGWRYGDKKSKVMSYYGEPMVKQGIAVASINYRLYPDGTYPHAYDDISCAMKYLKDKSNELNISNQSWGIMGDSAGAELAAYALQSEPDMPMKAFVGLYGPYDLGLQLTRTPKHDVDAANFTGSRDPAFATGISPISLPVKTSASYLLIRGQKDTIVSPEQSIRYHQKLQSAGARSRLILIPNTGHYISPTSTPSRMQIRSIISDYLSVNIKI